MLSAVLASQTQVQDVASSLSALIHVTLKTIFFLTSKLSSFYFQFSVGRKKRSFFGDGNRANYKVVKTDYTSYSVVYNCNQVGNVLKKGEPCIIILNNFPIS